MHYRDYLQQLIYKIINPVVKGLIKMGITPNIITTTGLILNIAAAAVFIHGRRCRNGSIRPAFAA